MNLRDEKGMRLESATVPAAVMPGHEFRDNGFMITCHCPPTGGWEGFIRPGQVRRPAITKPYSKLSGKKAPDLLLIPTDFLQNRIMAAK